MIWGILVICTDLTTSSVELFCCSLVPGFVFGFVCFFSFCFFYQISAVNNTLLFLSNSLIVFCNTGVQYPFAMFIYYPIPKKVTNSLDKNVSISFSKGVVQFIHERRKSSCCCTSFKRQVIVYDWANKTIIGIESWSIRNIVLLLLENIKVQMYK